MPRGNGLTYDHRYLRGCIIQIVEKELQTGDIVFSETIAYLLSPYKGLSKNDKEKNFCSPLSTLLCSSNYFLTILNSLSKNKEIRPVSRIRVKKGEVITAICGRTKTTPNSHYYVVD
tara:strand:+ start:52 stop:402 length:351 start_codon:yes stop_codon:yes gene_type:complete